MRIAFGTHIGPPKRLVLLLNRLAVRFGSERVFWKEYDYGLKYVISIRLLPGKTVDLAVDAKRPTVINVARVVRWFKTQFYALT